MAEKKYFFEHLVSIPDVGPAKWRVTVDEVIFGELRLLDSHTT